MTHAPDLPSRRRFLFGLAAVLGGPGSALAQDAEDSVERRVAEIFGYHLGVDPGTLKPADRFYEDMGLDDLLEIAEILTDVQKKFGIDILVDIATMFETMGNVIRYVKDTLAAKRV